MADSTTFDRLRNIVAALAVLGLLVAIAAEEVYQAISRLQDDERDD